MKRITLTLMVASALFGCKKAPEVPATYTDVPEQANIMPDYRDVTVPPNIAPLNFILTDAEGCRAVVRVVAEGKECAVVGAKDGIVEFDTLVWRKLMTDHRGASIEIEPYVERDGKWLRYKAHHIYIATEEIDPYLSYRLIEPGYELYRQLGLYQRNLTNWQVATIYENNRTYDEDENHCINCHTYRNNSTQDMLFHVRSGTGKSMC